MDFYLKQNKKSTKKIKAMTHYFLIKLSEKVKNCNPKQIEDFDFEYDSLTEGFTSGINKKRIQLPTNILKAGSYYIEGAIWRDGGEVLDKNDCYMVFEIEPRTKIEMISGIKGLVNNPYLWLDNK